MRNVFISAALAAALSLFSLAAFAQSVSLDYFNASPDGADVLVSWEITDQDGITNFKLFRRVEGESEYKFITHLSPGPGGGYNYVDYSINKDHSKQVSYKLQVNRGPELFSFLTSLVYNPTAVQKTWGHIKRLFME